MAWFALGIIAVAVLNKAAGGGPAGLFFAEAAVMIVAVPTVRRIERKACDIDFEVASYAFGHDEIVFVPDEWAGEESE